MSRNRLERAIREVRLPAEVTQSLPDADLVVTLKGQYRKMPKRLKEAEQRGLPIHVVRSNTLHQIQGFVEGLAEAITVEPGSIPRRASKGAGRSKGVLITFEGIDGCGKSTQAERLVEALRRRGETVVHTREPGGTELGQRIRHLFLHLQGLDIDPTTEALLMAVDRADHVRRVIAPALAQGAIIVCERFADSMVAYQGYGGELPLDAIHALNALATGGLELDVTFLLDVDPSLAFERRGRPADRIEGKDQGFYHKVRQGYLALQKQNPQRIILLDGALPIEVVHQEILSSWQGVRSSRRKGGAAGVKVSASRSRGSSFSPSRERQERRRSAPQPLLGRSSGRGEQGGPKRDPSRV